MNFMPDTGPSALPLLFLKPKHHPKRKERLSSLIYRWETEYAAVKWTCPRSQSYSVSDWMHWMPAQNWSLESPCTTLFKTVQTRLKVMHWLGHRSLVLTPSFIMAPTQQSCCEMIHVNTMLNTTPVTQQASQCQSAISKRTSAFNRGPNLQQVGHSTGLSENCAMRHLHH